MRKIQELEEALRSNGMLITEQEKTHEQKLEESKNKEIVQWLNLTQASDVDLTKPHIINLNEDHLLNGKVAFSLDKPETFVGTRKGDPENDIVLGYE